jgi:hypothetical protein
MRACLSVIGPYLCISVIGWNEPKSGERLCLSLSLDPNPILCGLQGYGPNGPLTRSLFVLFFFKQMPPRSRSRRNRNNRNSNSNNANAQPQRCWCCYILWWCTVDVVFTCTCTVHCMCIAI